MNCFLYSMFNMDSGAIGLFRASIGWALQHRRHVVNVWKFPVLSVVGTYLALASFGVMFPVSRMCTDGIFCALFIKASGAVVAVYFPRLGIRGRAFWKTWVLSFDYHPRSLWSMFTEWWFFIYCAVVGILLLCSFIEARPDGGLGVGEIDTASRDELLVLEGLYSAIGY
ncbi:hypothetical protein V8F20_009018 [Naviculisporaceae sp. PSN 640]